jgi:hypothetical protein
MRKFYSRPIDPQCQKCSVESVVTPADLSQSARAMTTAPPELIIEAGHTERNYWR